MNKWHTDCGSDSHNEPVKKEKSYRQQLVESIRSLGRVHGVNKVFTTLLEITALCISTETNPINRSERQCRYEEIIKDIDVKTADAYARMLSMLYLEIRAHADCPCDILGSIYHELNLNSEWNGQFFTPDDVCRMMAIIMGMPEEKSDVFTVNEPCCGSGAMVLGYAYVMLQKGLDCSNQMLVIAQDIDIRCVWMTYIQLTLYRIPAVVIHGNTLTQEEWSRWYTPHMTHIPTAWYVDKSATKEEADG